MSDKDPSLRPNAPKLALHVPEPRFRPGDAPDFSDLQIPPAGSAPRPDSSAAASDTHPLTTSLVRVLGDTARGSDLRQAIENTYNGAAHIRFEGMHYRKDIGEKGLKRW